MQIDPPGQPIRWTSQPDAHSVPTVRAIRPALVSTSFRSPWANPTSSPQATKAGRADADRRRPHRRGQPIRWTDQPDAIAGSASTTPLGLCVRLCLIRPGLIAASSPRPARRRERQPPSKAETSFALESGSLLFPSWSTMGRLETSPPLCPTIGKFSALPHRETAEASEQARFALRRFLGARAKQYAAPFQ